MCFISVLFQIGMIILRKLSVLYFPECIPPYNCKLMLQKPGLLLFVTGGCSYNSFTYSSSRCISRYVFLFRMK